ncbi:MAG: Ig-like domain-containing protein [Leptospira sp.]|nr:Ig-like domain-containing protein [Leptospira sp.]
MNSEIGNKLSFLNTIIVSFFVFGCTPKPEPFLLGLLALPAATATAPFGVTSTNPSNGETGINRNTNISILFNRSLDNTSISGNISFVQPATNSISSLSASTSTVTLTIRPSNVFDAASTYSITLKSAIRSTSGETLGSDFTFSFTTQ